MSNLSMTRSEERIASNIGEKPRSPVLCTPSHSALLKYSNAAPSRQTSNIPPAARSAYAKPTAQTPLLSWGANSDLSRRSAHIENVSNLDFLNTYHPVNLSRSSSTRPTSRSTPTSTRRSASCFAATRNPMRAAKTQRWAGDTRTTSDWDGLRRDPELWFENGDCLVHLYARGQSRRGPSFCVPFNVLKQSNCGSMFSLCFAQKIAKNQLPKYSSSGTSTPITGSSTPIARASTPLVNANTIELFIPAPEDTSRESSFKWHITTRNFFAFVFGKPLVGSHLGQTLVDLQERMHLFRSGQINNQADFLGYADNQGYRNFVDCPDYALAMLYYAEHYKLRDVWIDAFAHCVGMNESLSVSPEFTALSRLTKALITRAYLDMDIQLGRVTRAVRNFLEDDLSPAYLGLTDGARLHLDRFRSFLHSFYVEKFGYWPPPKESAFSKVLYRSLYYDFKNLYDYLVDLDSSADLSAQKPASGGICVLQNVDSFDKRHKFASLPHPLPLLPNDIPNNRRTESQRTLRALTLGSKQVKTHHYLTARAALTSATNNHEISVTSCAIVQAYMRFERQCALNNREEKVSMADARKVRWLLIYGTLQYLLSALRAPKEVRDTEDVDYPLCCLVTEQSPWEAGAKVLTSPLTPSVNVPKAIHTYLSESTSPTPDRIEPDCQRDDYFGHSRSDSGGSQVVSVEVPAPLRISQPTRNSSIRSFRRLSFSSSMGSRRNSVQKNSGPHCEIVLHAYGNRLNSYVGDPPIKIPSRVASRVPSGAPSRRQSVTKKETEDSSARANATRNGTEISWFRPATPDQSSRNRRPPNLEIDCTVAREPSRTPIIDSFRMDEIVNSVSSDPPRKAPSSSISTMSAESPFWSDVASSASSQSSTDSEPVERKTSSAEESGLLGGLVPIDSTPVSSPKRTPKSSRPTSPVTPNRRGEFRFSFDKQSSPFPDFFHGSPLSPGTDSDIGVALSAPPPIPYYAPPPPPMTSLSFEDLSHSIKPRPAARSISTESIPLSKFAEISPLRMHPPSVKKKENTIDIFSALSMSPEGKSSKAEEPSRRTGSEMSRSMMEAIPSPVLKAHPVSKKPTQATETAPEVEKAKKKERRKSFWRR